MDESLSLASQKANGASDGASRLGSNSSGKKEFRNRYRPFLAEK